MKTALDYYKTVDVSSDADTLHNTRRRLAMTPETNTEPPQGSQITRTDTDTALTDIGSLPFTWKTLVAISETEFVPKAYRGEPAKILGAVLYGRESGLGPMTSLQMVDMVDGKPSMSAELMVSLVRRAGHSILLEELSTTVCTVQGIRYDTHDSMTYSFSMEDAERAGLSGRGAWKTYPSAMLWARAVSQLIRMLFPDVLISMHNYTADELGADIPDQIATPSQIHTVAVEAAVEHVTTEPDQAPEPGLWPPDEEPFE